MAYNELLYEATYVKENGSVPRGAMVQFVSNKYQVETFLFDKGALMARNFEKEITEAFLLKFGKDVSQDVALSTGSGRGKNFEIRCLSFEQKYPEKPAAAKTATQSPTQSEKSATPSKKKKKGGCMGCLKKLIIWGIILIVAVLIFSYVMVKVV